MGEMIARLLTLGLIAITLLGCRPAKRTQAAPEQVVASSKAVEPAIEQGKIESDVANVAASSDDASEEPVVEQFFDVNKPVPLPRQIPAAVASWLVRDAKNFPGGCGITNWGGKRRGAFGICYEKVDMRWCDGPVNVQATFVQLRPPFNNQLISFSWDNITYLRSCDSDWLTLVNKTSLMRRIPKSLHEFGQVFKPGPLVLINKPE